MNIKSFAHKHFSKLGVAVVAAGVIAVGVAGGANAASSGRQAVGDEGGIYHYHINDQVEADLMKTPNGSVYNSSLNKGIVAEGNLHAPLAAKINRPNVDGLESDGPYPSATQLKDGANSTAKWDADNGVKLQRSWVMCPANKVAVGGGYSRADEGVAVFKNLQIVTSAPVQIKDGKEVYQPIAGDEDGSFVPNGWLVEGFNNGTTGDAIVRPHVTCVDAN